MGKRYLLGLLLTGFVGILCFSACSVSGTITKVPVQQAKLGDDAVLAIRISPDLWDIDWANKGYVLVANENGRANIYEVGPMAYGRLSWTEKGLFFGGPDEEYLLNGKGLHSIKRNSYQEMENARFKDPKTGGSIAIYDEGFTDDGYIHHVVTNDGNSIKSWEFSGMLVAPSQCHDKIFGIVAANQLSSSTGYHVRSDDFAEAIVQIYPKPENPKKGVIKKFDYRTHYQLSIAMDSAPCKNNTIYTQGSKDYFTGAQSMPALITWNVETKDFKISPIVKDTPSLQEDPFSSPLAALSKDGSHYIWIYDRSNSHLGYPPINPKPPVLSLDINTGIYSELFPTHTSDQRHPDSRYFITDNSIFSLEVDSNLKNMRFAQYNLNNGKRVEFFKITGLPGIDFLTMHRNSISDIAVNPEWLAAHDHE